MAMSRTDAILSAIERQQNRDAIAYNDVRAKHFDHMRAALIAVADYTDGIPHEIITKSLDKIKDIA